MALEEGGKVKLSRGLLGTGANSNSTNFYLALYKTGDDDEPSTSNSGYPATRKRITLGLSSNNQWVQNTSTVSYTATSNWGSIDRFRIYIDRANARANGEDDDSFCLYDGGIGPVTVNSGDTLTFPNNSFTMTFS